MAKAGSPVVYPPAGGTVIHRSVNLGGPMLRGVSAASAGAASRQTSAGPGHVVVVGGGLAGISAACELLECGCSVTILEKMSNLGGNSSKATCGIAVPGSKLQSDKYGLTDNGADLVQKGAGAWLKEAPADVEWLLSCLGLQDEMELRQTPGHQVMRTIGTKANFPGMVITYAAINMLKRIAETHTAKIKIITRADVKQLIRDTAGQVCGVTYHQTQDDGKIMQLQLSGPVIIATGGFCGDKTPGTSLFAKYTPHLQQLPTTNDERSNGDGLRLAITAGAMTERLQDVDVIPTALVNADDRAAPLKLIASTSILGLGGAILDATGGRPCAENGPTKDVADRMQRSRGPFRLVIGTGKAAPLEWMMEFYVKNKLMKKLGSGGSGGVSALAKEMGLQQAVLLRSLKGATDEDGKDVELFVGEITPAVYSCAGGLSCDPTTAQVKSTTGAPIRGLFAAGEVTASPETAVWSISGVPLMQCIVTGRAAGKSAAAHALEGATAAARQDFRQIVLSALNASKGSAPAPGDEPEDKPSEDKPLEELSKEELIAKVKDLQANGAVAAPAADAAPAGPPPITLEDVAKHNTKDDAWLVVNGEVIDVTKWVPVHPGGEQAIAAYYGKDATEEWNMIHKKGMVEQNLKYLTIIGPLGTGGGGGGGAAAAPAKGDGIELAEVAKHNTKDDAWCVINGQVLDVTKWIPVHPGGEAAIMAYLGADASEEWNMIHKPNMVEANLSNPNGPVVKGKFAGGSAAPPPLAAAGPEEAPAPEGSGCMKGPVGALFYMVLNVLKLIMKTILFTGNLKFSFDNNRNGTIRSAIFLLFFTIVHAGGNVMDLLVNNRPEEVNGEGYLIEDRLGWTGGGISLLEEYTVLCLALHVAVALKRSWDISMQYCVHTGRWNMLLSGLTVLSFLFKHLTDIRLYQHWTCAAVYPPKYFLAFDKTLVFGGHNLFSEPVAPGIAPPEGVTPVAVHDVYTREYELFSDLQTVLFYTACAVVFICHMVWGWKKLVPADAFQIPKDHVKVVTYLGQGLAVVLGSMYLSLVWFVYLTADENGKGPLADQVVVMPCPVE